MKSGKLNWDDLKSIIDNNKGARRTEVKVRNGIGEDCAVVDFGDNHCVLSTDPITGSDSNIGKLAVNINCNDIAAAGAEPVGITVTILAPEGTNIHEIKEIMKEVHEEAEKLNIEIIGGHTEITSAVNKIVLSCTVIGKAKKDKAVSTAGAKSGDDIIVTKDLAMEGSFIIAKEYEKQLEEILTPEELNIAKDYINNISVLKEGTLGAELGVNSMHDITEGGLLGAAWEVATASDKGFIIYEDLLPVSQVTKKICTYFKIDPLKLISSGSMFITAPEGERIIKELELKGIKGTLVGKITDKEGYILKDGNKIPVEPPQRDELFKIN
ncbi:AIR synthase family protein [Clostridium polynesiense]|uniref:AIR synthase family protein n=1 Tax=Clostridium polynesiense TaxID=1325933 RepID=UPI00059105F9|nr:AIR synthase family protein [Clostridium polynesiense]